MSDVLLSRGLAAVVDDVDAAWLAQWKWHATLRGYAARNVAVLGTTKRRTLFMHVALAEHWGWSIGPDEEIDHKDRDRLNNRRTNLRVVTHAQNVCNASRYSNNSSGFKGVGWHKQRGMWTARIRVRGELLLLGYFDTAQAAAGAYAEASKRHHGEYGHADN